MKYLLIAFMLISFASHAQQTYDATISFPLTDTTDEAGSIYKRRGFFEAMIYNQRTETVIIQTRIKFFNNTTELKKIVQSYSREFYIDNNIFVVSATGATVGNRTVMRSLYGVFQNGAWLQSVSGGDSLTTPCMGAYAYLTKQFDNQNKLSLIIKSLAIQAASEGKLN